MKNIKNIEAIQKENEHKERICSLYGICGRGTECLASNHVSHFGLKKLNEKKS